MALTWKALVLHCLQMHMFLTPVALDRALQQAQDHAVNGVWPNQELDRSGSCEA